MNEYKYLYDMKTEKKKANEEKTLTIVNLVNGYIQSYNFSVNMKYQNITKKLIVHTEQVR